MKAKLYYIGVDAKDEVLIKDGPFFDIYTAYRSLEVNFWRNTKAKVFAHEIEVEFN